MKRALLITYEFPPMGGVGVQRVLKLAKYLPQAGWDVSVLTVEDPPSALMDETLLAELPASVAVHRAWSLEPTRLVQWVRRRRHGRAASPAGQSAPVTSTESPPASTRPSRAGFSGLPPWLIRLVQAFFIPDEKRLWRGPAVRAALRVVAAEGCSAVVSSGPPFTAHLIGRDVARRTGLPWVVDLRDPWVGNYFFRPPTPVHAWLQARWEARVVRDASEVVVVSEQMAESLRSRYPDLPAEHFRVLPNGFDPDDMPAEEQPAGFGVAYLGVFQGSVAPDVFLEGLAAAIGWGFLPRSDVRFKVVGPESGALDEAVDRLSLGDIVEVTGYLPHREAIAEAAQMPVLLLVLPPGPAGRAILTGKLLEYLGLRRSVLALVPEGAARTLVEASKAGVVVDPQDATGVAEALRDLYRDRQRGEMPVPDPSVAERYDRRVQARGFAALLDELTKENE